MAALLKSLVGASEKSARIAQLCRQEEALFQLLIEEKTGTDKNKKFVQDFKTLADVLIQEVIKHDVGKEFPELHGHICGEESNQFENSLGETLEVQVCATQQDTASLLFTILDRNRPAAELLAAAIHQEVVLQDPTLDAVVLAIPPERLAIWIDPIDSTNQYIRGQASVAPIGGICPSGLRSALVLIGAYDRSSGDPVLGVINEPFFREDPLTHRWQGVYHWGISYQGTSLSSLRRPPLCPEPSVVLSSSETPAIQRALRPLYGERLRFASGSHGAGAPPATCVEPSSQVTDRAAASRGRRQEPAGCKERSLLSGGRLSTGRHGVGGRHEMRQVPGFLLQLLVLALRCHPHRHRDLGADRSQQDADHEQRFGLGCPHRHHRGGRRHLLRLLLRLLRGLQGKLLHGHHVRHPAHLYLPGGDRSCHRRVHLQGQGPHCAPGRPGGRREEIQQRLADTGHHGRTAEDIFLLRCPKLHRLVRRRTVRKQPQRPQILLLGQRHHGHLQHQSHLCHHQRPRLCGQRRDLAEETHRDRGGRGAGHRLLRAPGHRLRLLPHEGHPERLRGHVAAGPGLGGSPGRVSAPLSRQTRLLSTAPPGGQILSCSGYRIPSNGRAAGALNICQNPSPFSYFSCPSPPPLQYRERGARGGGVSVFGGRGEC
uniref:inositol-1,4-bisphosphate 1-phosphatase n=1 Tax=Gopherus agassizii TaxID=38772 RepID=A0A452H738_9SAUR